MNSDSWRAGLKATLFASTALAGLATLGAATIIPDTAHAQCAGTTVNSGGTTVIAQGVVVDCTGGQIDTSFSGAAARGDPISGYTLNLTNGTSLTGPANEPSSFPDPTTALERVPL